MAGQYGYHGSSAAEQSFARGNEYMVQAAGMQAQGLTNSAQLAAQSVRDFHRMLQERDEFQLRAQQADMEMQLNRQKLADMQAVDAATMSRKQIELMTAQIDAARQDMNHKERNFEYQQSIRGVQTDEKMLANQLAKVELDKALVNRGTHYIDDSGHAQLVKTPEDRKRNEEQRRRDPNIGLIEARTDAEMRKYTAENKNRDMFSWEKKQAIQEGKLIFDSKINNYRAPETEAEKAEAKANVERENKIGRVKNLRDLIKYTREGINDALKSTDSPDTDPEVARLRKAYKQYSGDLARLLEADPSLEMNIDTAEPVMVTPDPMSERDRAMQDTMKNLFDAIQSIAPGGIK